MGRGEWGEGGEQSSGLAEGDRDQADGIVGRFGVVHDDGEDGQEGMGEHRQGGPPVPGVPAAGRGVGQEHRDLRVLDPPGRSRVLTLHSDRLGALLQVAGLVDHEHRTRIGQVPGRVSTHVVPRPVGVPDRPPEQVLQPVRGLVAGVLGDRLYMLTGDNEATAKAIAEQTGIRNYRAEVLPQHKADFVKELQQQGNIVAMVGDGINDSTALATADVSIAMGKGSDIAMDVAKMTIISSDLTKIPQAIRLSKQTVATIKQNLFWAFIYNLIGIPIAAGILYPISGFLLNPMIAGAAMALSSVSVVTNSLRLKWKK